MDDLNAGQRLAECIAESGNTQRQIALTIGVQRQSITNAIRRGRVSVQLAQAVGAITGFRWEWIAFGTLPKLAQEDFSPSLRAAAQGMRRIPLISLAQAVDWPLPLKARAGMNSAAVDGELAADLGEQAFVMVVEDDSMRNNSAESVHRGDRVVIDPAVSPQPGDLVVAVLKEGTAVFRKYRERGLTGAQPMVELVPLNLDYAPLTVELGREARIVGVMVEHRRQRRLSALN